MVVVVSNSVAVVVAVRVVVVYRGCNCLARFGAVFAKKVLPEKRNQRVPVKICVGSDLIELVPSGQPSLYTVST